MGGDSFYVPTNQIGTGYVIMYVACVKDRLVFLIFFFTPLILLYNNYIIDIAHKQQQQQQQQQSCRK
jgi:hypothetical protein